jgi:hypothetical protein
MAPKFPTRIIASYSSRSSGVSLSSVLLSASSSILPCISVSARETEQRLGALSVKALPERKHALQSNLR